MRMSRYWMSGCMALVLLAAGRWPTVAERDDADPDRHGWVVMTSKLPLEQTARQLQRAARAQGMPVMADVQPAPAAQSDGQDQRVLVLGSQDGHTPVFQRADAAPMDLPLRVLLRQLPDGSTRIMFTNPDTVLAQAGVPAQARDELAVLPSVVTAALADGRGQEPRAGPLA